MILTILLLTVCAKAQQLKYGIMTGFDLSSLKMTNASGNGFSTVSYSIITYHVNGILEFKSDSWWGISLEPGFRKKGGLLDVSYKYNSYVLSSNNSRQYSCIELPVVLNIDLNKKFYLSTGLGLDYIISSKDNNRFRAVPIPNYEILPVSGNKLSCFAIVGLSYKISDTSDVGIRYNMGLTKLVSVNLISAVNNSIYCNSYQLSLKYNINRIAKS